jgi:diguanylate cyclase (GGDEF)-like protein
MESSNERAIREPSRIFVALLERCERLKAWQICLLALGWITLVGVADYSSGHEFGFSIFYLPGLMLGAWCAGRTAGLVLSLIAAAAWGTANYLAGAASPLLLQAWNSIVRFGLFATTTVLLTELHRVLLRERQLARTDPLTQVLNQRAFYEMLAMELNRARRYGYGFTIAYLDLDHFKVVNDRHGHSIGDEALRSVAEILTGNLRNTDFVGRLGGDEFALVLSQTAAEAVEPKLEELRSLLLAQMRAASLPITFSIGAITFAAPPDSVAETIRQADQLMYSVKTSGKDRIEHRSVTVGLAVGSRA